MKGKKAVNSVLIALIVSLMFTSLTAFLQQEAAAQESPQSHFRYDHIKWVKSGVNQATFDFDFAMRRSGCASPGAFSPGDGLAQVGDICIEVTGGSSLDFGDASSTGTIWIRVAQIDVANDFIFGNVVDPSTCAADASPDGINSASCGNWVHQYGTAGPFTAQINTGNRQFTEINNANSNYIISTLVDFNSPPSNTGSPISSLPAIVQCPLNAVCQYQVPGVDPDGDNLNYRLSTPAESGVNNQPGAGGLGGCSGGTLAISNTGLVTWNTQNCAAGLYSTSLRIEESNTGGPVHGWSMVDYLIQVTQVVQNPPIFDVPPMSPDNTVFNLNVGVPFNTPVRCSDVDALDVLTLGNLGLPGTASVSAPIGTNPVSQTFSWTPGAGDVGPNLVTFTCQDNNGNNANPHDYTFIVQLQPQTVGGEMIPLDMTMILLAGTQMTASWMIPVVLSVVGIGLVFLRRK
ncbi:MAG TPA: hypothetical protein VD731_02995 [Nitrosopumilaceae archaeon]|nr:hypothetical protein [Nitrosopumilaceae archaeon]